MYCNIYINSKLFLIISFNQFWYFRCFVSKYRFFCRYFTSLSVMIFSRRNNSKKNDIILGRTNNEVGQLIGTCGERRVIINRY